MTTNRPSCPLCGNNTKKNGTTSKSTTRWRCTHCGHSFTRNTQTHNKNTATMALFIQWATGTQSLTTFAAHHGVTRQTMHHRFRWCWWIIPTPTIDSFRIHDQIFLDATYLKSGCLLIAASKTHVINWTWARHETTAAEVSRVLFLGLCLDFHYFSTGVVFPKFGFDFSRRAVAQALVEP